MRWFVIDLVLLSIVLGGIAWLFPLAELLSH